MAAIRCDVAFDEQVVVDTVSEPAGLLDANPLGKIPTVLLDNGTALYDSRVICEYFDRISGNAIVPQTDAEWIADRRLEATADGVADAAILLLYEARFRPEEKRHEAWTDRQWRKALRGLAVLEMLIGEVSRKPTLGDLSVAALTGWLALRFAGRWESEHPRLARWNEEFWAAHPDLDAVKSRV